MAGAGIFASARVASGGGSISATFQNSTGDAADLSSYTFLTQPIGTASASRRVVVAASLRNTSRDISALTIGGVSAARDAQSGASANWCQIWSAVVPTGTTADVVVTVSGGTAGFCGIGVWSLSGGAPTGQNATSNINSGTLVQSVTTVTGDVVIGVAAFRASTTGPKCTWNTATEQYDIDVDTAIRMHSGADAVAAGSSTDMGLTVSAFSADASACAAAYA